MAKRIRIWRWCLTVQRGGQATPWPWTELRISRRQPTREQDQPPREPHPGETWWWPTECALCGEQIGPWDPNVVGSEMTHIVDGGGPDWDANRDHKPVTP